MPIEKEDDNDSFWNIERILPPRIEHPFSADTDTVEVDLHRHSSTRQAHDGKSKAVYTEEDEFLLHKKDIAKRKVSDIVDIDIDEHSGRKYYTPSQNERVHFAANGNKLTSELRYKPTASLIEYVQIWQWPKKYSFYEEFRSDAVKFHSYTSTESEKVPFFSFLPQYKNMTDAQMKYYFWWRGNIRRGKCLPADYSYILLYLFEIINLPDLIPADFGSFLICVLWFGYRERYPRLDKIASEWLCDYCLIHHVSPPKRAEPKLAKYGIPNCCMPEFYVDFDSESKTRHADHISSALSNYNWRKSKYYTSETAEIFDTHMTNALARAFDVLPKASVSKRCTVSRDAFTGAICSWNVKKRIDIVYTPVLHDTKTRLLITEIVKYSENGVRTLIGASSRFSSKNISSDIKGIIDRYFLPFIEERSVKKKSKKKSKDADITPIPAYEKLYDSPDDGELSAETAEKIENDSWEITDQLVELLEYSEDNGSELQGDCALTSSDIVPNTDNTLLSNHRIPNKEIFPDDIENTYSGILNDNIPKEMLQKAVSALLENNKTEFCKTAETLNLMPDSLVESINEMSYTLIGDISINPDNNGFFTVIDDYRNEMEEFAYGRHIG